MPGARHILEANGTSKPTCVSCYYLPPPFCGTCHQKAHDGHPLYIVVVEMSATEPKVQLACQSCAEQFQIGHWRKPEQKKEELTWSPLSG